MKTNLNVRVLIIIASAWCAALPMVLSAQDAPKTEANAQQASVQDNAANPATAGNEQTTGSIATTGDAATPSQNITINLINRLVQRGVLTKEDSTELVKLAEEDAARAKEAAGKASAANGANVVRVSYIPETVRQQMRDEIKEEVMSQAREENWADPRKFPSWLSMVKFNGDVRFRYQGDYYPSGNDNTGYFANYNSINNGSPYDANLDHLDKSGYHAPPPEMNVDQDRERLRVRARFGADVDFGSGFSSGIRFGSGDSNSPVSANQTLGGSGGNFSKYALWLDRGFIKYQMGEVPVKSWDVTLGRFDNPFFSTSMIWANDLGFDGAVIKGKYQVTDGVVPFLTAGAFPVYNTDYNFATTEPAKFKSRDKWLYGVQGGTDWKISKDWNAKFGAAFYSFTDIQGEKSSPIYITGVDEGTSNAGQYSSRSGDTDDSRINYAQKGNTYMKLRNYDYSAYTGTDKLPEYQYYGLASPFRVLALTSRLDYGGFDPFHIWAVGEFAKNLAFNRSAMESIAVNNFDSNDNFIGGDTAWIFNVNVGHPALEKLWDWNLSVGYRYVESDAVVDGFCDSDFGGGGTNLQGYTLGANLAFSKYVSSALRWMSANSIAGPSYKEDIIQFDITAKF